MRMFNISRRAFGASMATLAMLGLLGTSPANADTLDNVKARGKIIIGIQGDNPPFGFLDSTGKNDGYDADLARLFAKHLGVDLELVVVTNQNRIAALQHPLRRRQHACHSANRNKNCELQRSRWNDCWRSQRQHPGKHAA